LVDFFVTLFKDSAVYKVLHAPDELLQEMSPLALLAYHSHHEALHAPDEVLREMDPMGLVELRAERLPPLAKLDNGWVLVVYRRRR
jgi:hypothetical protein